MYPVWLCILSGRQFEDTYEDSQWRKVKQMQPVRICMLWSKCFEETFETHSGEKSHPITSSLDSLRMHFKRQKKSNKCSQCDFISSQEFEDTQNTQWRKVKQMQHVWLSIYSGRQFENAFESSQCKCKCKCSRCDFTPIKANDWRSHLKIPQRHIAARSLFSAWFPTTFWENTATHLGDKPFWLWLVW